jgi:hypothetical protein
MRRRTFNRSLFVLAALLLAGALPGAAQRRPDPDRWMRDCNNNSRYPNRDRERFCTVRETTMDTPSGTLSVDGGTNGGIAVYGTSRRDILVVARIEASARTEERAEELAGMVRIRTDRGRIYAEGPEETGRNEWWSVNFEVEVPTRADLDLRAHNGGLSVRNVGGVLRLETMNGGVHLGSVSGDVSAETTNGGVSVQLEGDRWQGRGLDATTTNGGIRVLVPENYNAHLETGTTNGGIDIDFPVTVRGRIGRQVSTDLGRGGATIRVMTTNGGVIIRRG